MNAVTDKRTFQPVRRDSFDIDDPRAQVFRPIEGGIKFVEVLLDALDEWDNQIKRKGERHQIGANARRVLEVLLRRCTDFRTGISEPCLDTLMKHTRLARATVVASLARLAKHGFIDWVRRTMRTDNDPGEGPQVKQVSNAYFFDLTRLPKRVVTWIQAKLRKKGVTIQPDREPRVSVWSRKAKRRRSGIVEARGNKANAMANAGSLAERYAAAYPNNPEIVADLLAMSESASSDSGLNPPSTIKGEKE